MNTAATGGSDGHRAEVICRAQLNVRIRTGGRKCRSLPAPLDYQSPVAVVVPARVDRQIAGGGGGPEVEAVDIGPGPTHAGETGRGKVVPAAIGEGNIVARGTKRGGLADPIGHKS